MIVIIIYCNGFLIPVRFCLMSPVSPTLTPRQRHYLEVFAKSVGNLSKTAQAAGVPRRTVYNWLKNCPAFAGACSEVNQNCIDIAEGHLFDLMERGSVRAVIFFLKTRGRSRGYF